MRFLHRIKVKSILSLNQQPECQYFVNILAEHWMLKNYLPFFVLTQVKIEYFLDDSFFYFEIKLTREHECFSFVRVLDRIK
jgi:hypothetical protein